MLNKSILLYIISFVSIAIVCLSLYYSEKSSWVILIGIVFLAVLKYSVKRIFRN